MISGLLDANSKILTATYSHT